ncbi:ParB/RepB/Spo0J family partition protein [bacterium]|nr:ParB/RepB/Spo0J family partition protein [bacterium]
MASKFGLGKGLSELRAEMGGNIPDISVLTGAERVVVKQIPLVQIGANPDQPRKTFTEGELAELAASIREKGVLQPILLRAVTGRPYMYEIVAGERRFRASKMAGLSEIPALVKTLTNENAMEIALIENVQRENLNPIEEAAAYQNLMEKCGYDLGDVTRLIGKSESYIRNIMRLTNLNDSVKAMVERGELSASAARTIAVAENQEELAHKIINEKIPVSEISNIVKQGVRSGKSRAFSSNGIDADTRNEIQAKIKSALGVSAKLIERRGGAGQIVLSFSSRIQMHELIDKLCK